MAKRPQSSRKEQCSPSGLLTAVHSTALVSSDTQGSVWLTLLAGPNQPLCSLYERLSSLSSCWMSLCKCVTWHVILTLETCPCCFFAMSFCSARKCPCWPGWAQASYSSSLVLKHQQTMDQWHLSSLLHHQDAPVRLCESQSHPRNPHCSHWRTWRHHFKVWSLCLSPGISVRLCFLRWMCICSQEDLPVLADLAQSRAPSFYLPCLASYQIESLKLLEQVASWHIDYS